MDRIKQRALYNNHIRDLMTEMENTHPECAVYCRLLAMETDMKSWLREQIDAGVPRPFITEEMLSFCEDSNVIAALELKNEIGDLLSFLGEYWQTTDEVKTENN